MVLIPTLVLMTTPIAMDAKVVDVETRRFVAGKLGHRVETRLTLEANGQRFGVDLPSYHTNVGGKKPMMYAVGDIYRGARWF